MRELARKVIAKYSKKNIYYVLIAKQSILKTSFRELEIELKSSKNPESLSRIDNVNEFLESLKDFENLEGFLEHVGLVMENISNTNVPTISLMTMHGAKGLEFGQSMQTMADVKSRDRGLFGKLPPELQRTAKDIFQQGRTVLNPIGRIFKGKVFPPFT